MLLKVRYRVFAVVAHGMPAVRRKDVPGNGPLLLFRTPDDEEVSTALGPFDIVFVRCLLFRREEPGEAINGRLEHFRGSALGFRNLTNYIARSFLETGGFRPQLHPRS